MSAVGLAFSVDVAGGLAGVLVPGALGGLSEVSAVVTKADGLPVAVGTTLALETRATPTSPWVEVAGLLSVAPAPVAIPVRELRVVGTVDPGDTPVVVQVFGRQ